MYRLVHVVYQWLFCNYFVRVYFYLCTFGIQYLAQGYFDILVAMGRDLNNNPLTNHLKWPCVTRSLIKGA